MNPPAKTLILLFTDIVGSTQLLQTHPQAMREAQSDHDDLIRATVLEHEGSIFNKIGDAFCIGFDSSNKALSAAIKIQASLVKAKRSEFDLRVRMALHAGAVEVRDNDYYGVPLHRVARLLSASNGGQILLSQAVYALLRETRLPDVDLIDHGTHRLKDLQPEHIFQALHPDIPPIHDAPRSLEWLPNNLPRQLTSFIGRKHEIAQVKSLLAGTCLLTLTGAGGSGKTRLSLHVAADLIDEYPDGVWLVELASISTSSLVPQAVANVLKVSQDPAVPLTEAIATKLERQALLLILDNCEHLVEACALLAESLLRACPNLRILATGRKPLRILGETAWRVPTLRLPSPDAILPDVSVLLEYEAVALFVERAMAIRPDFRLTDRNASAVVQICRRLDGIPLALELAAVKIRALSPDQIAERLDDRFRLLATGSTTAMPRQKTLQAMIDWSYDLLSEPEKQLLSRLSVFSGGCVLRAAEEICSGEGIEREDVIDLLDSLVEQSLVNYDEIGTDREEIEPRYRLLETIREYGKKRLSEDGALNGLRERHQQWYLGLAEEAEPHLQNPDQKEWLNCLEAEHDNLRASLKWAVDGTVRLRIASSIHRFWLNRGFLSEGRGWLEGTLTRFKATSDSSRVDQAKGLNALGVLLWAEGNYTVAQQKFQESLELFRLAQDKRQIARVLSNLGMVASELGDYSYASQCFTEILKTFEENQDHARRAIVLNNLGGLAKDQGDYTVAQMRLEESLGLFRKLNDLPRVAIVLDNLGNLACKQQDFAKASALYEEGLAISSELGHRRGIAFAISNLGLVAVHQQRFDAAAYLLGFAEATRDHLGISLPPSEMDEYESAISLIKLSLDEHRYLLHWNSGRNLEHPGAYTFTDLVTQVLTEQANM